MIEPDGPWRIGAKVIFSDEKKINLDGPGGLSFYRHDLRREENMLSHFQMGGGSAMILGGFGNMGRLV